MQRYSLLLLLAAQVAIPGCSGSEPPIAKVAPKQHTSPITAAFRAANDGEVTAAVLARACVSSDGKSVLSSDPAITDDHSILPDGIFKQAETDMRVRNRSYYRTPKERRTEFIGAPDNCPQVILATATEIGSAIYTPSRSRELPGGWDEFDARYPGAKSVLELSLPGYADSTHAVVELQITCGRLCGRGERVMLEKRGGTWVVAGAKPAWVS